MHGKFDAGEPLLSYLALGRGGADDGRLTAAEMFGLPLDKSRLVVLSACETGRAEATHANELLGMVRALIYAGAGTLVLSYWEVDSAATALWMQTFYEAAQSRPAAGGGARGARPRKGAAGVQSPLLLGGVHDDRQVTVADLLHELDERVKSLAGNWSKYTIVGTFLLYVVGYLTLRFHLTAIGIGTDLAVLDERYLFTGARFLVYLVSAVPNIVLLALPFAALAWVVHRLTPPGARAAICAWVTQARTARRRGHRVLRGDDPARDAPVLPLQRSPARAQPARRAGLAGAHRARRAPRTALLQCAGGRLRRAARHPMGAARHAAREAPRKRSGAACSRSSPPCSSCCCRSTTAC